MKKYFAILKINLLNNLVYPGELLTRSLMILLFMWIFFQLWNVAFEESSTGILSGLTLQDAMWYFLLAETLELGRPRLARAIAEQVRDGSIAYLLNKPYDFILYQLFYGLGESIPRMLMLFTLGGGLVWVMAGSPPSLKSWPLALILLSGAWLLHFCFNAIIGLAAFVVEEITPFEWIYQKFTFVLGGMLIPLDFYPSWLQTVSKSLPFAYMMYGPARIFVKPETHLFLQLLAGQFLWLGVIIPVLILAYSRSTRRLAINGG
jgi:ABC-2 type transport system permease protein